MLEIVPPFEEASTTEIPDLSALTSLSPLAGHCSVIHASRFFHLFLEERQQHLARALAGLLSAQPGSIICGQHVGELEKGFVHLGYRAGEFDMFCHSPRSWTDLWNGEVFAKGKVKVDVKVGEGRDVRRDGVLADAVVGGDIVNDTARGQVHRDSLDLNNVGCPRWHSCHSISYRIVV